MFRVNCPELFSKVVQITVGVSEVALAKAASVTPPGDVIEVLLARESVEGLVEKLHALDVQQRGSITVIAPDLVLSDRADRAEAEAPGEGADAVIWDEVRGRPARIRA